MIIMFIAFCLLFYNVNSLIESRQNYNREKALVLPYTISVFFFFLFCVTELFSLIRGINQVSFLSSWIVFIVINLFFTFRKRISLEHNFIKKIRLNGFMKNVFNPITLYVLFGTFMVILAYKMPPYNCDSMAYHLPRITHWIQNQSVQHFATHYDMQVTAPVFAEYIQLHNYILSGNSDVFICVTQSLSLILNGILIYNLSEMLELSQKWRYASVAIFVSLPVTFGEALNTQVDLITPVLLLPLVTYILFILKNKAIIKLNTRFIFIVMCMGICAGLSFLAKYTAAFAMIPFTVWLFIICVKNRVPLKEMVLYALVALLSGLLVFLPEATRLFRTFGSLFHDNVGGGQMVNTADPRLLLLCFIKNISSNLAGHYLYDSKSLIMRGVGKIAAVMNVDIVDPKISWYDYYDINEPFVYHQDLANGQLITILFLIALLICLIAFISRAMKKIKTELGEYKGYVISSFSAFVLFLTILKFTTHRARYEIVFFALLCPAVCYVFQKYISIELHKSVTSIIFFLAFCEIVSLSTYHIEQLNYFGEKPKAFFGGSTMYDGYQKSVELIKNRGYDTLGVIDDFIYEYPLWVMLDGIISHIENVNVTNETKVLEDMNYFPDCVLYIGLEEKAGETITVHGTEYIIVEKYSDGYGHYALAERPQ